MIEALWSVEFVSNMNFLGAGVVVFETGRVFGGDSQYYYIGDYQIKNGMLEGSIEVTHYSGEPWSIFGILTNFRLNISGQPNKKTFDLRGYLVEDPTKKIQIRLTRRAELP